MRGCVRASIVLADVCNWSGLFPGPMMIHFTHATLKMNIGAVLIYQTPDNSQNLPTSVPCEVRTNLKLFNSALR